MELEYLCKHCNRKTSLKKILKFCPICGEKNPTSLGEKRINELFTTIQKIRPGENSLQTANILTYELGDFIKKLFYAEIYPKRREVCLIEAKIALSDLITQCHIICKREGWSFTEINTLGLSRAHERITRRAELGE